MGKIYKFQSKAVTPLYNYGKKSMSPAWRLMSSQSTIQVDFAPKPLQTYKQTYNQHASPYKALHDKNPELYEQVDDLLKDLDQALEQDMEHQMENLPDTYDYILAEVIDDQFEDIESYLSNSSCFERKEREFIDQILETNREWLRAWIKDNATCSIHSMYNESGDIYCMPIGEQELQIDEGIYDQYDLLLALAKNEPLITDILNDKYPHGCYYEPTNDCVAWSIDAEVLFEAAEEASILKIDAIG